MIDDRTAVNGNINSSVGEFIWTREHNLFGWQSLLGPALGADSVPTYAAAARETNLSKLPATYLSVGSLDLFLEENMNYARALGRSGVPIEFHVYPGAYHGFMLVENARVSQQAERDSRDALNRLLRGSTTISGGISTRGSLTIPHLMASISEK